MLLKDLRAAGKGRGLYPATVEHMVAPRRTHTSPLAHGCARVQTRRIFFYWFRLTLQSCRFRGTVMSWAAASGMLNTFLSINGFPSKYFDPKYEMNYLRAEWQRQIWSDFFIITKEKKGFQFAACGRNAYSRHIKIHLVNCYSYSSVRCDLVIRYVLSDLPGFLL